MNIEEYKFIHKTYETFPFLYNANWEKDVSISYIKQSIVARTKNFFEQRRPAMSQVLREQKVTFLLQGLSRERFMNDIQYLESRLVCFPIFAEELIPVNHLLGSNLIFVNKDLFTYYNLNRAEYLIIADFINYMYEVAQINAVFQGYIELQANIQKDFNNATTSVFPCFIGKITRVNTRVITTHVMQCDLTSTEIIVSEPPNTW